MKWKSIVKRNNGPLFTEFLSIGLNKRTMKNLLSVNFGFDNYRIIDTEIAYFLEEIEQAKKEVEKQYQKKGIKYFKNLFTKWYSFIDNLENTVLKIAKENNESKNSKQLIDDLIKIKEAFKKCSTSIMAPVIIEEIAEEYIKDYLKKWPDKINNYLLILTAPEKKNETAEELKSILEITIKLKNKEDISKDIEKHIRDFGWLNTKGFYGDAWSKSEIENRIRDVLTEKESPEKRLVALSQNIIDNKKQTKELLRLIKAKRSFTEFIKIIKELVYFRTHRVDVIIKSGFILRPFWQAVAQKINISMQDLFYLVIDEMIAALKGDFKIKGLISQRKKDFGYILQKDKIKILTGKELENYKKIEKIGVKIKEKINQINGNPVSKGKVNGTVKVLSSKNEINKVQKGDILVASMTMPDYVPAMERAAAFVTDEGGITCHAAIVAREMKKPCIVGTKIATKVLKDGDSVEVDADKGIVKKL